MCDSSVTVGKVLFSLHLFPPTHCLSSLFTLQGFSGKELSLAIEHVQDLVQWKHFLS